MKKLMLACCFVIGAVSMSFAQGGQGGQGGRRMMDPAAQTARLKDALKLTDDQATKVTAIYTAQSAKMDSLMKAANGDFSSLRTTMQPMREATNAKIKALLTPEQAAEFDKLPPMGRGGRGGRGGQGGGQGGAAPAQK